MERILLATEGPSEDAIGEILLKHFLGGVTVDRKRFPARGIDIVRRAVPNLVRAAHFGYYDLLVIHFDLDDSVNTDIGMDISASPRWQEIEQAVADGRSNCRPIMRVRDVEVVFMAGCQSTDGWLCWGRDGGDGRQLERMSRHTTKEMLYGRPPRSVTDKAKGFTQQLITRLDTQDDKWPVSLRFFIGQLRRLIASDG